FTLRSPDSVGRTARSRGSTAARPEPSLPPESAQSRPDSAALPRGARPHASRHLASRSSPPIPGCGSSEAQALRSPLSRRRGISSLRSSEQRLQYVQVGPYREREQHAGQTLEVVELGHVGRLHAGQISFCHCFTLRAIESSTSRNSTGVADASRFMIRGRLSVSGT